MGSQGKGVPRLNSKTGSESCAVAVPSTSETKTIERTKNGTPPKNANHLHDWVKFKKCCTLNDHIGHLENRDCSGTSVPLQSHRDDNDDSESDSTSWVEKEASPSKSTPDFPNFDLYEGSDLEEDEDVCKNDFTMSFSLFHCALQDGFGQTWWTGNMTIPLQFASLDNGQEFFLWSDCLLDLGTDFLVSNMVFVWGA